MAADLVKELTGLGPLEVQQRLREAFPGLTLAERFEVLHRLSVYHHSESTSGHASTLRETAAIRRALPRMVAEYGVASILDIPCGDFHWLQRVRLDVEYTGADIVPEIVAANQRLHSAPGRRFVVLDATAAPLPCVDLILCRDLLIHLSLGDCWAVLGSVVASRSRLLLTNHFVDRVDNPDILSGDFRPVNLCAPPFSFQPPMRVISENSELGGGAFRDRALALWRVSEIAERVRDAGSSDPSTEPGSGRPRDPRGRR